MISRNNPDSKFFLDQLLVKWVALFWVLLVSWRNLTVTVLPIFCYVNMKASFSHRFIQPLKQSHLIFTGKPTWHLDLSSTLSQLKLTLFSTKTQVLVITSVINVENGSVESFELIVKSFSDLLALSTVVSHCAGSSHVVVLSFSVESVVEKILVLEDWVWFCDSGDVAFSGVGAWVVDQKAFQVDSHLSALKLVEVINGLNDIWNVNAGVAFAWNVELVFLEIGELFIELS